MPYTDSLNEVIEETISVLLTGDISEIGIHQEEDVYYGVETRYPRFPAIAVEGQMEQEPTGTQHQMTNKFRLNIFYYEGVIGSMETKRQNRDKHAEAVKARLHANRSLNGKVAFGHITSMEPGISVVSASMVSSSRMIWEGISKTEMR